MVVVKDVVAGNNQKQGKRDSSKNREDNEQKGKQHEKRDLSHIKCYRCDEYGHFVSRCPERNRNHEVNLNETQEKELKVGKENTCQSGKEHGTFNVLWDERTNEDSDLEAAGNEQPLTGHNSSPRMTVHSPEATVHNLVTVYTTAPVTVHATVVIVGEFLSLVVAYGMLPESQEVLVGVLVQLV
ncbi:hypothetical protein CTI12_AA433370 [Artemisia annua]|uniref:CCHC-type domain-containing protein n=1 Tax=Artemisia annua TaxID=35608 RepID=A0A2U1M0F1_ARTAN|nr:hypothetical protein CTI12_AA433370 [Artemisia annua]